MNESRSSKKSKEEIAKQFDLPERKSKIATILKQDDQAYCICRTSDSSRFMICCDACEEWYHGDCINVTEKEAKHIKHYFCQRCKEADPTLQTVFRAAPNPNLPTVSGASTSTSVPHSSKKHDDNVKNEKKDTKYKKRKEHHRKTGGCGHCGECLISKRAGRKSKCKMRVGDDKNPVGRPKKRKRSVTPEVVMNPSLEGIRQCFGPQCTMTARPQSKYCSDECGVKLATSRIYQVLPQRIQEWNLTPSKAQEINQKALDANRAKQAIVLATLNELEKRRVELDLLVDRAKRCIIDPKFLENTDNEDESSMYCITCGHEIHSKFAIRHMEKCFNKYESQASFGSIFKTRLEEASTVFCEFYNPASKTYCKRLKVLCPEHSKDLKASDTDVCGCPLVRNVFQLTGEFCRAPKKSCYKHYFWEKIRRAEIDQERMRQLLKMDELIEQERQIKIALKDRASVMGLILHSTYNHEIMERFVKSGGQQLRRQ